MFVVVKCQICNNVIKPILTHILGYTNDQQLAITVTSHLVFKCTYLLISWHEYVQQCCEVYSYVTQWSTFITK